MKTFEWSALDEAQKREALARPSQRVGADVTGVVLEIMEDVAKRGGEALIEWCIKLDGAPPRRIPINEGTVKAARNDLAPADTRAIRMAAENIRIFHEAIKPSDSALIETAKGVRSKLVWRAINTAGLYVPGGTAPLFSSLLMQAIPAQVAGVKTRVAVTPPTRNGRVHPAMIIAAAEAGLEELWAMGGAQAIAALTYGVELETGTIPRCDKLFGPGNAYVAEAKKQANALPGGPAVDMPAGPSELMVVADASADPVIAAADLLSQAEHDRDAQVILVARSKSALQAILEEVEEQVQTLPRAEIARASLNEARAILARDPDTVIEVINMYGPEHLALQTEDAGDLVDRIEAAGAIFVGSWAAETLGDYAAGPSHVLPTDGGARTLGGITTASFMTSMSVQYVNEEGARTLGPIAARLARLEGLEAHARAADLRSEA
jgi:histidinol dehydrogenase